MSEENVEVVRRVFDRWGQGDFRAGMELFDPQVLLVLRPEFPDSGALWAPTRSADTCASLADLEDARIVGEEFLEATTA